MRAVETLAGWSTAVASVLVLSLFTTAGYADRNRDDSQPYTLLVHHFFDAPFQLAGIFTLCVLGYTATIAIVIQIVKRWDTAHTSQFTRDRAKAHRIKATWQMSITWIYGRWWRLSLFTAVAWAPILIMQAPGTSNADLVMQALETLSDRSSMDYPPFDVYPIAHYLIPNDDVLLSNHHNALLTLTYGNILGLSITLFDSFRAGFVFLTVSQAIFTLVAFGAALRIVGKHVPSIAIKTTALVALAVCGAPVAMWSIAIAKNPLFAAAFIWWLAIAIDFFVSRHETISLRRIAPWGITTLIMLVSAKFAIYIIVVQLIILLIARRRKKSWVEVLAALAVPVLLFQIILRLLIAAEVVIPGDPLAGKGPQIQSLALALRESPTTLTDEQKADLDKIFDVEIMSQDFDQWTMAPIRGAGYREGAYRWKEVTRAEAARFDKLWLQAVKNEPLLIIDGIIMQSFRFFDPLSEGRDNTPSIRTDDGISAVHVNGHVLSDDGLNDHLREALHQLNSDIMDTPWLRLLLESSLRVALVVVLAIAGILMRRPAVWIWALPLALHCGVLIISPLASSGRYALGITYAIPLVVLALGMVRPRAAESESLTTITHVNAEHHKRRTNDENHKPEGISPS